MQVAAAMAARPHVVPPRWKTGRAVSEPPRVRANREVDVKARAELAQDASSLSSYRDA